MHSYSHKKKKKTILCKTIVSFAIAEYGMAIMITNLLYCVAHLPFDITQAVEAIHLFLQVSTHMHTKQQRLKML